MSDRATVIYYYDGTYDGLMCCIFESFARKEMPIHIFSFQNEQATLFSVREIITDCRKAVRVRKAILQKISSQAAEIVRLAFLTCEPEKELMILKFLRLGFHYGPAVTQMLARPTVSKIQKSVRFLLNERHRIIEFLRFSDYGGNLVAIIKPKNCVLPLIGTHFCTRFPEESFLIYDKSYGINRRF